MIDTSEILVSKEHIDPLRDSGFVIYKLGRITPVNGGKREALMLWGNVKNKGLTESEIESIVVEIVTTEIEEISNEITNIIEVTLPTAIKTASGNNHESFLIENTEETEVTVASSWTVEKYNEQVGEFKAVVMIRDKSLDTIKKLMNILSFDYSDAVKVVDDTAMLTNASITLVCGVNAGTKKLFATLTGMTENAKRIHLCFERCVLSERFWDIDSEMSMILETTAYLQAYLNLQATADMALNFEVGLSGYSNLQAQLPMVLDSSAILTAYGRIQASMNMELDGQALLTAYKKLIADSLPMSLNAQAVLKAYASLSAVNIPMSLVTLAELSGNKLDLIATMAMQMTISGTVTNKPAGPVYAVIKYGYEYNYYALLDSRNMANTGWHVARELEYWTMLGYLGGLSVAGGKMKEIGTSDWSSPNTGATNSSKFNARPCGCYASSFGGLHFQFHTGCRNDYSYNGGTARYIWAISNSGQNLSGGVTGFNVYTSQRLIKDSTTLTNGQEGTYTGNDGKLYRTICIGTQEWLADNLLETKYRNGDTIPLITSGLDGQSSGARVCYNHDSANA
jgi:hypothetical protein